MARVACVLTGAAALRAAISALAAANSSAGDIGAGAATSASAVGSAPLSSMSASSSLALAWWRSTTRRCLRLSTPPAAAIATSCSTGVSVLGAPMPDSET